MTGFLAAWRRLDEGRDRTEFYRLWRVGAAAGFTVPKALETMGVRAAPRVEGSRQWLLAGTRRGGSVGELVRKGGAHFDAFERALLVLGDESGRLEVALGLLADFNERKHRLTLAVRKRLAYPLFTGLVATLIAPIPLLVAGRAVEYIAIVAAGLAAWMFAGGAIVLGLAHRYERTPALVRARLARALASGIEAGLPLGRALRLAADASDPAVKSLVGAIDERTLTAQPVAATLAKCPHMSVDFLGVLQVADTTGDFSGVTRLAELYEDGFR